MSRRQKVSLIFENMDKQIDKKANILEAKEMFVDLMFKKIIKKKEKKRSKSNCYQMINLYREKSILVFEDLFLSKKV